MKMGRSKDTTIDWTGQFKAAGGLECGVLPPAATWLPYQKTRTHAHAPTGLSTTKNPIVLINENRAQRDKPGHATQIQGSYELNNT